MKRSSGVCGHDASRTAGIGGSAGGWNAQNARPCSTSIRGLAIGLVCAVARVRGTHRHPLRQDGDLALGQLAFGRHLQVFILVSHRLDQEARLGFAGLDRRAAIAPLQPAFPVLEVQSALQLLGLRRVAFVAAFDQQGPDAPLEEVAAILARWRGEHEPRCTEEQENDDDRDDSLPRISPPAGWSPCAVQ